MKAVMETYKRLGISPTRGRGSWLFDDGGNRYLDFIGGIATNSLGHGHPALVNAIKEQAETLMHCSNLYEIPIQAEAAAQLTAATNFDKVFFCNSGTESVEAAIKLARKHAGDSTRVKRWSGQDPKRSPLLEQLARTTQKHLAEDVAQRKQEANEQPQHQTPKLSR